ncbi:MAG: TIR domain-containing protein [Desulfobacterales bacterium]|nr:TIR domain-containing protein [Desulfobacterales bacterium]
MSYVYEVALSFAGEDRAFAEAVAKGLQEQGISVFYDDYSREELWGEDLSIKLREIYYARSRYCIMILSEHYVDKMWASYERQQAIERLIEQRGTGYVLPVRLDGFDGDVPGLPKLIGYLSVRSDNPKLVVEAFLRKIARDIDKVQGAPDLPSSKPVIPKLKKAFTDKEKNQFLRQSFKEIVKFIDYFASETRKQYPHFEYDMERLTSRKVIFTLYDKGNEITRFKIWLGSMTGGDSIYLLYGSHVDIDSDNSFNEYISLEEHESGLKLKPMGMMSFNAQRGKLMSPREVAEYLWEVVSKTFS